MDIRCVGDGIRLVGSREGPLSGNKERVSCADKLLMRRARCCPGRWSIATNEASGIFRESITGPDGGFFMSALTPGVYEVTAQLTGSRSTHAKAFGSKSARRCPSRSARSGRDRRGNHRDRGFAHRRYDVEAARRQRARWTS